MSRIATFCSVLVCLLTASSFGEKTLNEELNAHNIGMAAGFVTGYGLSYRHWFPGKNGFQLTLGPYGSASEWENDLSTSLGLVGLRAFFLARYTNLFGYYGVHWRYSRTETKKPKPSVEAQSDIIAGLGPGIDIHFWHLSLNLMFGLAAYTMIDRSFQLNVTGEGALYYGF